ncbi:WGxxGxxG family protein [Amycolatopsis sp. NPDC098790]|uniref:WGxxGxxG family protein n=1 Tax=Amycolatopsis sp. NPDC098790 TaxID=3363939 RepID=UPI00382DFCF9
MIRNLLAGTAAAAAIAVTGAFPASAAPAASPVAAQADNDDNVRSDNDDNNGLWGLLGLVGLLGLAGLARRGPKTGAMAGYPAAGGTARPEAVPHAGTSPAAQAPPVNTYPPAEPRRTPPGA